MRQNLIFTEQNPCTCTNISMKKYLLIFFPLFSRALWCYKEFFLHTHKKAGISFLTARSVLLSFLYIHKFTMCGIIFSALICLNWNSSTTSQSHRQHDEWEFWRSHEDHLRILFFFHKVVQSLQLTNRIRKVLLKNMMQLFHLILPSLSDEKFEIEENKFQNLHFGSEIKQLPHLSLRWWILWW